MDALDRSSARDHAAARPSATNPIPKAAPAAAGRTASTAAPAAQWSATIAPAN